MDHLHLQEGVDLWAAQTLCRVSITVTHRPLQSSADHPLRRGCGEVWVKCWQEGKVISRTGFHICGAGRAMGVSMPAALPVSTTAPRHQQPQTPLQQQLLPCCPSLIPLPGTHHSTERNPNQQHQGWTSMSQKQAGGRRQQMGPLSTESDTC